MQSGSGANGANNPVKRPRPRPGGPMRRTTSMKALADGSMFQRNQDEISGADNGTAAAAVSGPPLKSSVSLPSSSFLQACFLCKRRLSPARDIYMYRGDAAFCSAECRQEQIVMDERKEKFLQLESRKIETSRPPPPPSAATAPAGPAAQKVQATA